MVGDSLRDLEAAKAAGCRRILVRTGGGAAVQGAGLPSHVLPTAVYNDLREAVEGLFSGPAAPV
jgi:D-glycero-D-manno-heptose 1,7-bisphosphate phosphatase